MSDKPEIVFDASRCGTGDLFMASWVFCGYREIGRRVMVYCPPGTGHWDVLRMVGQEAMPHPDPEHGVMGIDMGTWFGGYHYVMNTVQDRASYVHSWCETLPGEGLAPSRPIVTLPDEDEEYGERLCRGRSVAVIFPRTTTRSRSLRSWKWHRIAEGLVEAGLGVLFVTPGHPQDVSDYADDKGRWDVLPAHSWPRSAAIARNADVCLGNDSGPLHMVAALGEVPGIAVIGPTAQVYAYADNVHEAKSDMECTGCWFQGHRGYRMACNTGCESMDRLEHRDIVEMAVRSVEEGTPWKSLSLASSEAG
jgi:hypothetical protein